LTGVRTGYTAVVLAYVSTAAVGVPLALPATAGDGVGLGDVSGQAAADGVPRPGHRALRVGAAGGGGAGVRLFRAAVVGADVAC